MTINEIVKILLVTFRNGGKALICGNGGSAAEAQHFSSELMCGMYHKKGRGFPAIALTTDTSIITAWSNDINYDDIFSRQVEVLGDTGDVLIVLSTSGKSTNCLNAARTALAKGLKVVDLPRVGETTARIQENHLKMIHKICAKIEKETNEGN
jgi:D-sedoheptulose 7-phosphate isomerase